jgi:glucokinase
MLSAILDDQMKVVARRRRKTKGSEGSTTGIPRIIETIERNLQEAGFERNRIAGIGIGCPGPVDSNTGEILVSPNLGWKDLRVGSQLQKHFGCPVAVLNDVDAGVYGEYRFGAGKDARCLVGIFPGTGIGGGCVYEGTLLRGASISCMEVGHTRLSSDQRPTGVAMLGTLESEASRLAIAAEAAKAVFRGDAPTLQKLTGTDISEIRSSTLAISAVKDKSVREIIEHAASLIGIATANLIHLLGPDRIVLGGGLVEAMPELLVSAITKSAKQNVLPPYRDRYQIVPAKLGDDATVLGAAAWAQQLKR